MIRPWPWVDDRPWIRTDTKEKIRMKVMNYVSLCHQINLNSAWTDFNSSLKHLFTIPVGPPVHYGWIWIGKFTCCCLLTKHLSFRNIFSYSCFQHPSCTLFIISWNHLPSISHLGGSHNRCPLLITAYKNFHIIREYFIN